MDLKSIKPVYLALIAVAVIGIAAVLVWVGLVHPAALEEANSMGASQPWEVMYLGMIDSQVTGTERQEHVDAFIKHNAGVKDACEIMHFHSLSCGACQRLTPWLDEFRVSYPEVLFTSYEIHETESRALLEAAKMEYGISSPSVPIIFICGSILEGVEAIQNVFEPMALAVYNLPIRNG